MDKETRKVLFLASDRIGSKGKQCTGYGGRKRCL